MENENNIENVEEINKKIIKSENRQLMWIFGIIVVCFLIFAGVYLYIQSQKSFNFAGASWKAEDYKSGNQNEVIYHGRLPSFVNKNVTFNLYLMKDPRTNNVSVDGDLTNFMKGGILSFSPEVDKCRGDVAGSVITLGSFLRSVVGIKSLESGTTDFNVFNETNRTFADCAVVNRGVVILKLGNESSVKEDARNQYCYTITMQNCSDIQPIEKFIIGVMEQEQAEKSKAFSKNSSNITS